MSSEEEEGMITIKINDIITNDNRVLNLNPSEKGDSNTTKVTIQMEEIMESLEEFQPQKQYAVVRDSEDDSWYHTSTVHQYLPYFDQEQKKQVITRSNTTTILGSKLSSNFVKGSRNLFQSSASTPTDNSKKNPFYILNRAQALPVVQMKKINLMEELNVLKQSVLRDIIEETEDDDCFNHKETKVNIFGSKLSSNLIKGSMNLQSFASKATSQTNKTVDSSADNSKRNPFYILNRTPALSGKEIKW